MSARSIRATLALPIIVTGILLAVACIVSLWLVKMHGAEKAGLSTAQSLAAHPSLRATLEACDIAPARWGSFVTAFESLLASDVVRPR